MIRALEFDRPRGTGGGVRPGAAARDVGRTPRTFDRGPRCALLRRGDAVQPRRPRIPGQGVPGLRPVRAERVRLACYLPDAILPFGAPRAGQSRQRTHQRSSLECPIRTVPRTCPITSPTSTRPIATIRSPSRERTSSCSTRERPRGAAIGRGASSGTSLIFSDRAVLGTLEGDPRFFFDDSQTPQAQGTGTEEWGGGGDYWGGRNMTLPFAGHPVGARNAQEAQLRRGQDSSRPTGSCWPI